MNLGDSRGETRKEWTHTHSSTTCDDPDCAPCVWLAREMHRLLHHEYRLDTEYRRALVRHTPWGYRGTCTCGWKQPFPLGTEKAARRAWYEHKAAA